MYGEAEATGVVVFGDGLGTGLADDFAVAFVPACGDALGCGVDVEVAAPLEPNRVDVSGDGLGDAVKALSTLGEDFGCALYGDRLPGRIAATWPDPLPRVECRTADLEFGVRVFVEDGGIGPAESSILLALVRLPISSRPTDFAPAFWNMPGVEKITSKRFSF